MRKICILILILPTAIFAEHDLRQIEKYCEVSKYDDYGEFDCRSRVTDRRNIERKCEVYFIGEYGEIDCRGTHFKDLERKCFVYAYDDDYGEIDC